MIIDGIIFNNRQSAIEYQNKRLMFVIMMQLALQSKNYNNHIYLHKMVCEHINPNHHSLAVPTLLNINEFRSIFCSASAYMRQK